jgi:antiviral helicase SKI2
MGFSIPGLDELRFHLAPTGSGDVHVRVEPVAYQDPSTPSTPGEADVHLYPLAALPSPRATHAATAAEHLRPVDDEFFARLAAAAAGRLAAGREQCETPELVHQLSAPRTTVVPTLPPLDPSIVADEWGAGGTGTGASGRVHLAPPGWKEVLLEDEGTSGTSSSLARRPGAAADFVRGSLANLPFTPGGAGWEAAAAEAAAAREATARHASASWLAEYEAGVYAAVPPGFPPSPWTDAVPRAPDRWHLEAGSGAGAEGRGLGLGGGRARIHLKGHK